MRGGGGCSFWKEQHLDWGFGFRVSGSGVGVESSGFRVQGSGFRVQGWF